MSALASLQERDGSASVPDIMGSLGLNTLLATAGGYLDGFTYFGHGHVFANTMTGNVVLLGIEMLGHQRQQALQHLLPILTFVAGIWAAKTLHLRALSRLIPNPHAAVLAIEMAILFALVWLPPTCPDVVITTCVAFAASLQVQTFRTVRGHTYTSTFTTGNLRSLSEALFERVTSPNNARDEGHKISVFAIICFGFFLGAAAGGYVTGKLGNSALWVELSLLALALRRLTEQGSRTFRIADWVSGNHS